jgi:PEP-CTERM motif
MKKITITLGAAMAMAMAYGAYGQAYLSFLSNNGIYDDFTSGTPTRAGDMYVDFIWMAGGGQTLLGSATTAGESVSWSQIENLSVGTTGASWGLGSASELALTESNPPPGVGNYNEGRTFVLSDETPGNVISLYAFAWDAADGYTVSAAAAANAPIGWSGEIDYTLGSIVAPGVPLGDAGGGFDVDPISGDPGDINPAPEPTTLALAGLGALSMIFLLRRNKA